MTAARWRGAIAGLLLTAAVVAGASAISESSEADQSPLPKPDTVATIGGALPSPGIAPGFVGFSIETQAIGTYLAQTSQNRVLYQLIRNLAPGQAPVLRIGGDSTDHSWWPEPGVATPNGITYAIGPRWTAGVRSLARAVGARLILGINLEANNPKLAGTEGRALLDRIGRRWIQTLEIGNEPSLYGALPWYETAAGQDVTGRPHDYTVQQYMADFNRIRRSLPAVALAAPALGAPRWMAALPQILAQEPLVNDVTYHRYPLDRCYTARGGLTATLPHLLNPVSSRGLASSIVPFVRIARAHGIGFRVDELNSVACEGKQGVSNTFGSALWMLDTLFAMARAGATGVNVHTFQGGRYRAFGLSLNGGHWSATVAPVYYGMLMFARAAPAGSRLEQVKLRGDRQVRGWATRTSSGTLRVVLINPDSAHPHYVTVRSPGGDATAALVRLRAPGLKATGGVTLGGSSFANGTRTGLLSGPGRSVSVRRTGGGYEIALPAASAGLLTITGTRSTAG